MDGAGLPAWPEYRDVLKDRVLVLGDTVQVEASAPTEKHTFFNARYARLLLDGDRIYATAFNRGGIHVFQLDPVDGPSDQETTAGSDRLKIELRDVAVIYRGDRLGLRFDEVLTEYVGWNATHGPLAGPPPDHLPEVTVRWGVRGQDAVAVERFTKEIAPLVLAGPPTVTGFAGGRPRVQEVVAYWPALIDRTAVEPFVQVELLDPH